MMNWIYCQIAMYYLRKAHKVGPNHGEAWTFYMAKSAKWIDKVKA